MGARLIPDRYGRRAGAVLLLLPLALLLTPRAVADPGAASIASAADPTVALLQALAQLGPTGALLGAAYLLGRWQPTVRIELSADPALRRVLRALRDEDDPPAIRAPTDERPR